MSTSNIFPLWKKTGCIPSPKMEGDRVSLGLLQSLLARHVGRSKTFSNELLGKIETSIKEIITDDTSVEFSENEGHLCVDILSKCPTGMFGYTLFLPRGWLGGLRKKDS